MSFIEPWTFRENLSMIPMFRNSIFKPQRKSSSIIINKVVSSLGNNASFSYYVKVNVLKFSLVLILSKICAEKTFGCSMFNFLLRWQLCLYQKRCNWLTFFVISCIQGVLFFPVQLMLLLMQVLFQTLLTMA